jgi:1-acyl-sn-glycerol-3-phosphate acyltransferase
MFGRIERAVRALGFGAAHLLFGAGSVYLGVVHIPRVRRGARTGEEADARSVEAVAAGFRRYAACLKLARLADFDIDPIRVGEPSVLVANHPTIIDVICVVGATERTVCVAGGWYFEHPLLAGVLRASRFIDGGDGGASSTERLMEEAVARLREGYSVLVFPEGTRSRPGEMWPFGRSAFEIASRAGVPVVPIVIEARPPFLTKGFPWYRPPPSRPRYRVRQLPPVRVGAGRAAAREATRRVERALREALELPPRRMETPDP